jgi:hypothetical protein
MKNETRENFEFTTRLTVQSLQHLKDRGFRYVLVKGFSMDKRLDYTELRYFMLIPIKDLPDDPAKMGIYEPIDSEILMEWASFPDDRVEVLVAVSKKPITPSALTKH